MEVKDELDRLIKEKTEELAGQKPISGWKRFYKSALAILLQCCVLLIFLLVVVWLVVKIASVAASIG